VRCWPRAEHAAAQVSQAGLKLEEAKTKKLLGCARLQRKRAAAPRVMRRRWRRANASRLASRWARGR
jgi:hypothetical protein